MNIKVSGREYKVEYTFEAALDKKCVDICWNYFSGAYMMKGQALEGLEDETAAKMITIDKMIEFMSDVPNMSLYLFYSGLLENHADEITSADQAKHLYKAYRKENPESDLSTFNGLLAGIKKQMETDGFFKEIGLQEFMDNMEIENAKSEAKHKIPQDHKKTNHSAS